VFFAALVIAAIGAEVNLRTFFTYFGNFVSYFDRILTLENGARVWTDIGEWFWGWRKWLWMLGETILISYVGTLFGAILGFSLNFLRLKIPRRRRGFVSSSDVSWNSRGPSQASCSR
jgi:phosphonate transport system permease protein